MLFEWMADPAAWAGLATLIVLEIVLGIDNLVFIAILADKLPPEQRNKARIIGLSLALIMRLGLLASISWIVTLTYPVLTIAGNEFSWRDIILIAGGTFLLFKGTMELHERLEGHNSVRATNGAHAVFWHVIAQIVVLDAVFSLDSVITAVGMVEEISIMVIAVIVAILVMILASQPLMAFVSRHPTVVILCLGFLLMIGFSLIVEGFGFHMPKGYLYAAIGFSILIEAANQIGRRNIQKRVSASDIRDRTAQAVLKILRGGQSSPEASQEVAAIVSNADSSQAFSDKESSMIEQVLTLGQRPVRSIMVPRVDVVWLDAGKTAAVTLGRILESGRSRFPVCEGDTDKILGVVHAKDLLEVKVADNRISLREVLRTPLYVLETLPVLKLLEQLSTINVHMAIVVDEHGTFRGIVTPTDILMAIAGDLPEIAEDSLPAGVRHADGRWTLEGGMHLRDVELVLKSGEMPVRGDYVTLAGFVLDRLGRIPAQGDTFEWNNWRFEVAELDSRRVEKVLVRPMAS